MTPHETWMAAHPNMARPTLETYSELQQAYDFFNCELFNGVLPQCLVTLQREKRCQGYFSRKRFVRVASSCWMPIAADTKRGSHCPLR